MSSNRLFALGDRVRVADHHHWARGERGVITRLPRKVATLAGPALFYWVEFDVAQIDADGDGPYSGGEIIEASLEIE